MAERGPRPVAAITGTPASRAALSAAMVSDETFESGPSRVPSRSEANKCGRVDMESVSLCRSARRDVDRAQQRAASRVGDSGDARNAGERVDQAGLALPAGLCVDHQNVTVEAHFSQLFRTRQ